MEREAIHDSAYTQMRGENGAEARQADSQGWLREDAGRSSGFDAVVVHVLGRIDAAVDA